MLKKVCSFFMPLLLVLGLFPVSAFAADDTLKATTYVKYERELSGYPTLSYSTPKETEDAISTVFLRNGDTLTAFSYYYYLYGTSTINDPSIYIRLVFQNGSFEFHPFNTSDNTPAFANVYVRVFNLEGDTWKLATSGSFAVQAGDYKAFTDNYTSVYASDVNVYNSAGDLVFQGAPLAEGLEIILETLKAATIPAVFCLALSTGLLVLRRVFSLFLRK